jgi:hypothetical protein
MDRALAPVTNHKKGATQQGWEEQKSLIHQLYVKEKRPLRDVMSIMQQEYGFYAT